MINFIELLIKNLSFDAMITDFNATFRFMYSCQENKVIVKLIFDVERELSGEY